MLGTRIERTPWGLDVRRGVSNATVTHTVFPVDMTEDDVEAFQSRYLWDHSAEKQLTAWTPAVAAGGLAVVLARRTPNRLAWTALAAAAGIRAGRWLNGRHAPALADHVRRHVHRHAVSFVHSEQQLLAVRDGRHDGAGQQELGSARALARLLSAMDRLRVVRRLPDTARQLAHMLVRRYVEEESAADVWQTRLAHDVAERLEALAAANVRPA